MTMRFKPNFYCSSILAEHFCVNSNFKAGKILLEMFMSMIEIGGV